MSQSSPAESLNRSLRFYDVYALSVGSVIGTGIFFLPGKAAAQMGPAAAIPLLIGAVLSFVLVLCYAEAASRFQGTGGAMRYGQQAFGDVVAFEIGWATWIARVVSWAALSHAFVNALETLWPETKSVRLALIVGLVVVLTAINLRGVGMGGRVNTLLTVMKVIPLLAFIGIGVWFLDLERFTPFAPRGYDSLGATTVFMLYAYVGFEGMVIPAGEIKEPRKTIPRALLLGMATIFVIYAGIWTVCTGTLDGLAGAANPVGDAAGEFMGASGGWFIQVGILISVIGINAFMALVTPRALYALSQAKLFFPWFGKVNGGLVPARAIIVTSLAVLVLALWGTFAKLAVISVVARIAQYIPTCLSVLKLRSMPSVPEARFKVAGGPVLPIMAVAVCAWLLYETPTEKLIAGAIALGVGIPLYVLGRGGSLSPKT